MKRFVDVEREVVVKRECTSFVCDLCSHEAEHPAAESFEWAGAGDGSGVVSWERGVDGESFSDQCDLCPECAEALVAAIRDRQTFGRTGGRERAQPLLILLGHVQDALKRAGIVMDPPEST